MGTVKICAHEMAKTPYFVEAAGIHLYSVEELAYYLYENIYLVDGDVNLDDLHEELGVNLESETSETIGGFIIDMLGEIPDETAVGRIVAYENYELKIMAVQDRRIERVKIYILDKPAENTDSDAPAGE